MAQTPLDPSTLSPAQEEAFAQRLLPRVRGADIRKPLPDAEAALAYGEQVILATEGQRSYATQSPFQVEDRGETWLIVGTHAPNPLVTPVKVELRKRDGSVVQYGMTLDGVGPAPIAR